MIFVNISDTKVLGQTNPLSYYIKNSYFAQYKLDTPNNKIIFPIFVMNKPFKCCGIIYFIDKLAETTSGYGDGRKTKENLLNLIEVFLRLINVLRTNPGLFAVSPPLSLTLSFLCFYGL